MLFWPIQVLSLVVLVTITMTYMYIYGHRFHTGLYKQILVLHRLCGDIPVWSWRMFRSNLSMIKGSN